MFSSMGEYMYTQHNKGEKEKEEAEGETEMTMMVCKKMFPIGLQGMSLLLSCWSR